MKDILDRMVKIDNEIHDLLKDIQAKLDQRIDGPEKAIVPLKSGIYQIGEAKITVDLGGEDGAKGSREENGQDRADARKDRYEPIQL